MQRLCDKLCRAHRSILRGRTSTTWLKRWVLLAFGLSNRRRWFGLMIRNAKRRSSNWVRSFSSKLPIDSIDSLLSKCDHPVFISRLFTKIWFVWTLQRRAEGALEACELWDMSVADVTGSWKSWERYLSPCLESFLEIVKLLSKVWVCWFRGSVWFARPPRFWGRVLIALTWQCHGSLEDLKVGHLDGVVSDFLLTFVKSLHLLQFQWI